MQFSDADLQQALRTYTGHAAFRSLQRESIAATLAGRDSLTILPTGGGKSLTFQLPPLVANKTTIVISPLIALARDQASCGAHRSSPGCGCQPQPATEAKAPVRMGRDPTMPPVAPAAFPTGTWGLLPTPTGRALPGRGH